MNTSIQTNFNGVTVSFRNDAYLNATAIASHFGKLVKDYLRNDRTKDYITALIAKMSERGNPLSQNQIVIVKKGNSKHFMQGTWLHPKLAIDFARWLNAEFAVWCDEQIERILYGNQSENTPTTPDERTGLRQAVTMLTTKRGLMHGEAYSLVHQRFNVEHIDQIPREKLGEAVEYVQRMALEGEFIPRDVPEWETPEYKAHHRKSAIALMTVGREMESQQADLLRKLEDIMLAARDTLKAAQQCSGAVFDGLHEAQLHLCFDTEIMKEGHRLGRERANLRKQR